MALVSLCFHGIILSRYVLFDGEFLVRKHSCSLLQRENTGCIAIGFFQESSTGKERLPVQRLSSTLSITDLESFSDLSTLLLASLPTAEKCRQDPCSVGFTQLLSAVIWKEEGARSHCRAPASGCHAGQHFVTHRLPPFSNYSMHVCHVSVRLFEGLSS